MQVLQVPMHQVTVVAGRVGGAFGGKASRAPIIAALAAVAARAVGRPVSLVLPRRVDMQMQVGWAGRSRCPCTVTGWGVPNARPAGRSRLDCWLPAQMGRSAAELHFDVGFEADGRVNAIDIRVGAVVVPLLLLLLAASGAAAAMLAFLWSGAY